MSAMWSDLFHLGVPLGEKVLRALLVYVFLVVALRIAGKREMAQLSTIDFVVLLAVANAVQNGLIGDDISVTGAVVGASVLFAVNGAVAWMLYRLVRARRFIEGVPTLLVRDGVVDERALRHERISAEDLLAVVQAAGADSFADVDRAVLEPSGRIVVVPRRDQAVRQQYEDLCRRLDDLTALVRQRHQGGPAPASG
jgi:uncharacterized membrane protein YcaP (DUF421 family)